VGKRLPNAWGLYDVEGNAWEWSLTKDGMANRRGGSWMSCDETEDRTGKVAGGHTSLRKYYKVAIDHNLRRDDIGFRCVCDAR